MSRSRTEFLAALGQGPAGVESLERDFVRTAAALVVDLGGLHAAIERDGPAAAAARRHAAHEIFRAAFDVHDPLCVARHGGTLLAAFASPGEAILAALDGLGALRELPDALPASAGIGYGELLLEPDGAPFGAELDRAALLAHAAAPGLALATADLMTSLDEPPPGVGLHLAPKDRCQTLGMRFFVVSDYRG